MFCPAFVNFKKKSRILGDQPSLTVDKRSEIEGLPFFLDP
jgi:hypothetical protein